MTGLYADTYLTRVDGTVYRVREADDEYFLKKYVGDMFYIGDDG